MVVLCIFLCIACYYDYRQSRIPNWLVFMALLTGIVSVFPMGGPLVVLRTLCQAILTAAVFYPLFCIGTLGAGDVKLFGVCAGFLPAEKILTFLFFSLLFAAIHSLIRFLKEPDLKDRFCYLFSWLCEVADQGKWRLYFPDREEQKKAGICLAGPVLCSILLYMGGLY